MSDETSPTGTPLPGEDDSTSEQIVGADPLDDVRESVVELTGDVADYSLEVVNGVLPLVGTLLAALIVAKVGKRVILQFVR